MRIASLPFRLMLRIETSKSGQRNSSRWPPPGVLNSSVFAIVPMLEEVFAPAEFEARTKGLEALLDCSGLDRLSLQTDRAKLKEILANLLANAVRYTRHGSVRLRAGLDRQDLRLTVEDTGIGIDGGDQERIFDEFTRLNENRAEPR